MIIIIIPNNIPDTIIHDNVKQTCFNRLKVAISGDINAIKKEAEKFVKYKYLATEIQRMWNVTKNVIPVIVGQMKLSENDSGNT
jgi:hypothetical protein